MPKPIKPFLWIAAISALAAGCNFAPKYKAPPVETPAAFKETNGWKVAEPAEAQIKGKWWEMFGDAELSALEDQVTVSNQSLISAFESFLASREIVKEARAQLFPTISADPSVTKGQTSANTGSGVAATSVGTAGTTGTGGTGSAVVPVSRRGIFSSYTLPLDAAWQPDLWGSIRNTTAAAAYASQASAAQVENLRLSIQSQLATTYFQLRSQDELIALYSTTIRSYRESLELTKTLLETGIDSDLDVAQADSLLETTLAQATALEVQRAQYEHAIALLVGKPASTFSLAARTNNYTPPPVPLGLPAQLLERRPDIAAAERNVAQANANIGVARAAYFPTLSLTGSGGFQSSKLAKLVEYSSLYWTAGATAAEVIFDAGKRNAAARQAWDNYRANVATYRQTVLTAFQQVEDNLAALRILGAEVHQQDVAVAASQKNLELATERYRLGINSYLNVITAQVSLLNNQQTAVNIHLQQMNASVQLVMDLGGGWSASDLPSARRVATGPAPASLPK